MPNSEDSFGSSLTELLPCPFCGGEGRYDNSDVSAHQWIACTECGVSAGVKEWNLRTSPVPAPAPTGWEPVAEVFTMEALVPGGYVRHHVRLLKKLPAGTKLYVAPAVEVV